MNGLLTINEVTNITNKTRIPGRKDKPYAFTVFSLICLIEEKKKKKKKKKKKNTQKKKNTKKNQQKTTTKKKSFTGYFDCI